MHNSDKHMEGIYALAVQWPFLRYLGMGAWWAWIWLCYNSIELMRLMPEGQQASYVLIMYLGSTSGIATVMLVAAAMWRRFTPFIENARIVVCMSLLACLSTIVLGYSEYLGGMATFTVAAILTGVGTSFLCLKMGQTYGSLALRDSLTVGAVSLIFATFLYYTGTGIPQQWRIVFIALLPVLSAFLFIMPGDDPFPADSAVPSIGKSDKTSASRDKTPGMRSYRHLVIASALVVFTSGVGKGISSFTLSMRDFAFIGSGVTLFIAIIAVLIIPAINRGNIVHAVKRMYSALMLLGVLVLLATCFGLDLSYMSIGKEVLWMVFSCLMAYMVFRFDFSPVRAFGIGQAVYFISSTVSWAIGGLVARYADVQYLQMIIAIAFAFLIVLILTFVFTDADIKYIITWRPKEQGDNASKVADSGSAVFGSVSHPTPDAPPVPVSQKEPAPLEVELTIQEMVQAIDPRFGLSVRERQILELFAQGRSANWIADFLTISKNTVRSHLRAIYTKLDVHTRQELLDFLRTQR